MQGCENVVSAETVDQSAGHVADVGVDVEETVDGGTNDVLLAVVIVELAGALAVVVAAVYAVDAKSVVVVTAADFELDVLDGLPDYPV